MIKRALINLIKVYQKTLSPDHGPLSFLYSEGFCRFKPTCSQYTIDAIERFGAAKGTLVGFYRINRCNPWSRGGWDEATRAKPDYFIKGLILLLAYIAALFVLFFVATSYLSPVG